MRVFWVADTPVRMSHLDGLPVCLFVGLSTDKSTEKSVPFQVAFGPPAQGLFLQAVKLSTNPIAILSKSLLLFTNLVCPQKGVL